MMMQEELEIERLTVTAAANRCGVCAETVRRWIKTGQLQAVKIGGRVFVPANEIVKLIQPVVTQTADAADSIVLATSEGQAA